MNDKRYVLVSLERTRDGYYCFWRPAEWGYTYDLDEAGLFNKERAAAIVQTAKGGEVAWPKDHAEAASTISDKEGDAGPTRVIVAPNLPLQDHELNYQPVPESDPPSPV